MRQITEKWCIYVVGEKISVNNLWGWYNLFMQELKFMMLKIYLFVNAKWFICWYKTFRISNRIYKLVFEWLMHPMLFCVIISSHRLVSSTISHKYSISCLIRRWVDPVKLVSRVRRRPNHGGKIILKIEQIGDCNLF